jgi:hypothetical protein
MKSDYTVSRITIAEAKSILSKYHYLGCVAKSGYNYGVLTSTGELVGCIIFTGIPTPELAAGMFGLLRTEQEGLFELSRLCLSKDSQLVEHNLASWFISKAIKLLRKSTKVRAILSYADSDHHTGVVYRASNFGYYGLSASRSDFWIECMDGSFRKHSRGKTSGIVGEWRPRSRKHRYVIVYDKLLTLRWELAK